MEIQRLVSLSSNQNVILVYIVPYTVQQTREQTHMRIIRVFRLLLDHTSYYTDGIDPCLTVASVLGRIPHLRRQPLPSGPDLRAARCDVRR